MNAITPYALCSFLDAYLDAKAFKDYAPNGLQVDACAPIRHLVTGVTACQALIEAAILANADAILVHHGYFWKGEEAPLTGIKGKRIRTLLQHNISLIAYHLPLDAHPKIGNNALLADALGIQITGGLDEGVHPIGNIGKINDITPDAFAKRIGCALNRAPLHIPSGKTHLRNIGLCTGAAQDMINKAHALGCDAFISGEASERTTHLARELGIDYFGAGHHATETFGVKALGDIIAQEFGIKTTFVDIHNPI